MFNKKKKVYYVKKDVAQAKPYNPMHKYHSIKGSKFSKRDTEGSYSSLKKLLYIALVLFIFWILKESFLSINIFQ